ncbi:MAG: glycosyltransferase family 39 protein [Cyanobacteria bacterium Co-bin13]|nr:glycosyltransferase family 39 protein [Cyanobacteria bacterium Co-bin13]
MNLWTLPPKEHLKPVLWLLGGGLLVRAVIAAFLFPGFDEAYYYLYSRYLQLSYFDHPPLVALTTGLGWWLTGVISPFTIRLGALLLHTLNLWLLYQTAVRLFSAAVGRMALAIATLVPLFAIAFGILTSPDNTLILFWTMTLYWAAVEFFPAADTDDAAGAEKPYRPTWRVCLFGLWVGLACLGKYHGFVLALSLVGFCLATPRYRRVFGSPWTWLALGIFGLTLFPLWFWNLQHDWISFQFQLSMRFKGAEAPGFSLLQLLGYWLIIIVYLFPGFGLPLWWVSGRQLISHTQQIFVPPVDAAAYWLRQKQRLVLWISLPILLLFTYLGGSRQILPAWPAPGFWGMTLLLACYAVEWQRQKPRLVRRWLWGSGIFLGTLAGVALLHITTGTLQRPGNYSLMGGLVAPKSDPSRELINVQQLGRSFQAAAPVREALEQVSFVFTNEYYLGGYLAMALHPWRDIPVTSFSQDPRGFAFWFDQQEWLGQDALYITLERFHEQPDITNSYRENFAAIEEIAAVPITRGGAETEVFHVYRATQFLQPYRYPY